MICSKEDTGEGREQEKVSIKTGKKPGRGLYFLPLLLAAPMLAAAALAVLHYGPRIQKLLNILIKMVVKA